MSDYRAAIVREFECGLANAYPPEEVTDTEALRILLGDEE